MHLVHIKSYSWKDAGNRRKASCTSFARGRGEFSLLAALLVVAVAAIAILGSADIPHASASNSLWTDDGADLYSDHKASDVDDIVTIIIVESAEATEEASTESGKEGRVGFSAGSLLSALKDLFSLEDERNLPDVEVGGEDSFQAFGTTARSGSLQALISARVEEVLPNGNLKVRGEKSISINEEDVRIVISGIVRPEDINTDNTVLSSRVADVKIGYEGEGVIGDKQEPGILTRLLDWLF